MEELPALVMLMPQIIFRDAMDQVYMGKLPPTHTKLSRFGCSFNGAGEDGSG